VSVVGQIERIAVITVLVLVRYRSLLESIDGLQNSGNALKQGLKVGAHMRLVSVLW
jgi:hypothetical protein